VIKGEAFPSIADAARSLGIKPHLAHRRMHKGLSLEQALELEPFPDWFIPGKGQFARKKREDRIAREIATGLSLCSGCKTHQPLDNFNKSLQDGKSGKICKECLARRWIKYRYKIESDLFFQLVEKQKGKCAICKSALDLKPGTARKRWKTAIDHCHKTGKVRGVLCMGCNQGIGMFCESIASLRSAVRYLENHNSASEQSHSLSLCSKMPEDETTLSNHQMTLIDCI
jgi:hypothetical protein